MEFIVEQTLKNEIEEINSNKRKSITVIRILEKIFAYIGPIGGILYIILNILIPGISEVNVRGTIQKNFFWIFLFGTIIVCCSLCVWILLFFLRMNISSIDIRERTDENLSISNGYIIYSYRIKYKTTSNEKMLDIVALSDIRKIEYNQNEEKLIIYGKIVKKCIDTNKQKEEVLMDDKEESEMTLYNYFKPNLILTLTDLKLNIDCI